ncbi:MAG: DUF87 domain-containing protein [Gemmatimonadota bacterium]
MSSPGSNPVPPAPGSLYLGRTPEGEPLELPARDLTTHGVIVGMTGSGKTGLGIILLEELLAADIPCLVVDPKGDMGNLLLNFPEFHPGDFEPWVDPGEARRRGVTPAELAATTAETWKSGLAGSRGSPERMRAVRDGADIRLITPGSSAGLPLNLVGELGAPDGSWDTEAELLRDEIEWLVSGILVLAGLDDADPLTSREHILLSNLVEHAWRRGMALDLPTLIGWIGAPPLRKLGVFDLETFFPEKDRMKLALRLNGLVASPSFSEWLQGEPLDMDALLRAPDGRPRASILHLAHLSDRERLFVVARVLSKLVTWMRQQPGTSELRALLYADEIAGFAPPTATPPTKRPILTLYKQARAHGVGVVLATQNPVDMDYKIMSNAGTWMVGRLQTQGDKKRILEGLRSASGEVDVGAWDARIGELGKREFLLRTTRDPAPSTFSTRWAMSYLRGPLARTEIVRLRELRGMAATVDPLPDSGAPERRAGGAPPDGAPGDAVQTEPSEGAGGSPQGGRGALADDETPLQPRVADAIPVGWLDPAAPWAGKIGAGDGVRRLTAGLAARLELLFDDRRGDLRHTEEWEALFFPLTRTSEPADAFIVDYDERDFRDVPPDGATYRVPEAELDSISALKRVGSAMEDFLYANRTLTCYRNRALGLYSRVDETRDDFLERCLAAAEDAADAEAETLRDRYESRLATARRQVRDQERRVRELEMDAEHRRREELVSGAGDLLGMFLGGRGRTRSLSRFSTRRSRAEKTGERLRSATEKMQDRLGAVEALERELQEELAGIWAEWEEKAREIESFEVGLEKSDLRVTDLRVFFAPAPDSPRGPGALAGRTARQKPGRSSAVGRDRVWILPCPASLHPITPGWVPAREDLQDRGPLMHVADLGELVVAVPDEELVIDAHAQVLERKGNEAP